MIPTTHFKKGYLSEKKAIIVAKITTIATFLTVSIWNGFMRVRNVVVDINPFLPLLSDK